MSMFYGSPDAGYAAEATQHQLPGMTLIRPMILHPRG